MPAHSTQPRRAVPLEIPDKLYFRIGEVAHLCDVPAYVLRFWEGEFPQLKPNKSGTGQRLYRKRDVETTLRIKRLLYDEGYTIPGARHVFQSEARELRKKASAPELPLPVASSSASDGRLQKVRKELRELLRLLSTPLGAEQREAEQQGNALRAGGPEKRPASLFEL